MQIKFRTPTACAPEKFGLNAQNIAVAAAEMEHGLDSDLTLNELAGDQRAEPGARPRPIRDVNAIDSIFGAKL